jgi:hypothetical protein
VLRSTRPAVPCLTRWHVRTGHRQMVHRAVQPNGGNLCSRQRVGEPPARSRSRRGLCGYGNENLSFSRSSRGRFEAANDAPHRQARRAQGHRESTRISHRRGILAHRVHPAGESHSFGRTLDVNVRNPGLCGNDPSTGWREPRAFGGHTNLGCVSANISSQRDCEYWRSVGFGGHARQIRRPRPCRPREELTPHVRSGARFLRAIIFAASLDQLARPFRPRIIS